MNRDCNELDISFQHLKKWLEYKMGKELGVLMLGLSQDEKCIDWLALGDAEGQTTVLSCKLDADEKVQLVDCELDADEKVQLADNDKVQEQMECAFVKHFLSKTLDCQKDNVFVKSVARWPNLKFLQDYSESSIRLELAILGL